MGNPQPPIAHAPNVAVSPRMPKMMPIAPKISRTSPSVFAGTFILNGGVGRKRRVSQDVGHRFGWSSQHE